MYNPNTKKMTIAVTNISSFKELRMLIESLCC